MRKVRLISKDGSVAYESMIEQHFPTALIFCNRVFLYSMELGNWSHYREVPAERIRHLDTLSTSPMPTTFERTA